MMWKEVKTWASSHDYKVERTKIEGTKQSYDYFWEEKSNPNNKGRTDSVFNLAKTIYNRITDNRHVEHQENYENKSVDDNVHKDQVF